MATSFDEPLGDASVALGAHEAARGASDGWLEVETHESTPSDCTSDGDARTDGASALEACTHEAALGTSDVPTVVAHVVEISAASSFTCLASRVSCMLDSSSNTGSTIAKGGECSE
jgi:hypothetical protein